MVCQLILSKSSERQEPPERHREHLPVRADRDHVCADGTDSGHGQAALPDLHRRAVHPHLCVSGQCVNVGVFFLLSFFFSKIKENEK